MNTVPAWLVPGAEAAIVCTDRRSYSVFDVIIEKVGKRDVVCSNGARFNINQLHVTNGSWGPIHHLVERTDPRVTETRAKVTQKRLESVAMGAYEDWNKDRTVENAAAVIAAFTALTEGA